LVEIFLLLLALKVLLFYLFSVLPHCRLLMFWSMLLSKSY
jgi:hypothetical protein